MVEGAPHTAKRSMINLCVHGVPPSPYIKEWRRGGAGPLYGAPWGVLLPPGVGFPPFQVVGVGDKEGEERREGRRGRRPSP